jgi:S1-C subfamily serine protease
LLTRPPQERGSVGIEVADLSESVAATIGAPAGVVVVWLQADGPAKGKLLLGDVIEQLDGHSLASREQWDVQVARLAAGQPLRLGVRRRRQSIDVTLSAAAMTRSRDSTLGLTLAVGRGQGAEIVRVEPDSAGDRAGLAAGDVINLAGETQSPNPRQVSRALAALRDGQRLLIVATRGSRHIVTAVER